MKAMSSGKGSVLAYVQNEYSQTDLGMEQAVGGGGEAEQPQSPRAQDIEKQNRHAESGYRSFPRMPGSCLDTIMPIKKLLSFVVDPGIDS